MGTSTATEIGCPEKATRRRQAISDTHPKMVSPATANIEIGAAAKPLRRQGANCRATTMSTTPLAANKPVRSDAAPVRRKAKCRSKSKCRAPSATPIQAGGNAALALPTATKVAKPNTASQSAADPIHPAGNGAGASMPAINQPEPTTTPPASTDIADIVADLVRNQQLRKFTIKQQSRCDRSVENLIARMMDFDPESDEKSRKAVYAKARAFRVAVESGKGQTELDTHGATALSAIIPAILASAAARKMYDELREKCEEDMEHLAMLLPVYPFVKKYVRGLAARGLAVIVAEAGIPLGDYRTVSGLWKRLGLAVINGRAQRRVRGEAAIEQRYSPGRRAEIWAFCSDRMFLGQWRGPKDEDGKDPKDTRKPVAIPAHPIGPYGEVYARRRAATALRDPAEWPPARCLADAKRIMTKALILDLWLVWRGLPPKHGAA